MPEEDRL